MVFARRFFTFYVASLISYGIPQVFYNRTIFSDVNPFSALRVSTIRRAC